MKRVVATSVSLLIFSVGDVAFAMEAEQAQRTAPYTGEQADDLYYFHEEFGFGDADVAYRTPVIVTIRTKNQLPYRIIIDSMEDIAEFSLNNIRPFPPLLEPFALRNGMWGILHRNGKMVIVVDFERLFQKKLEQNQLI